MTESIYLTPEEMTEERMQFLEDQVKIIRLTPDKYLLSPGPNNTKDKLIYASDEIYGPHKLIAVTVNRFQFGAFGTHDDNEEFILIGDPESKPLYLVVALCTKEELDRKIRERQLSSKDFVALKVKYNDPKVSFFVMLKDVPHGEATVDMPGKPPYFYVTEPRDQTINITDFGLYDLTLLKEPEL
jgi:hypothetical protein